MIFDVVWSSTSTLVDDVFTSSSPAPVFIIEVVVGLFGVVDVIWIDALFDVVIFNSGATNVAITFVFNAVLFSASPASPTLLDDVVLSSASTTVFSIVDVVGLFGVVVFDFIDLFFDQSANVDRRFVVILFGVVGSSSDVAIFLRVVLSPSTTVVNNGSCWLGTSSPTSLSSVAFC